MFVEDDYSNWNEADSEEERREAEEALYHQIYHTYQSSEQVSDELALRESASNQNDLAIPENGGILLKKKTVSSTSPVYTKFWLNIKTFEQDEDSSSQSSEDEVKCASVSDSEIVNLDSEGSSDSELECLHVKKPVRTYRGRVMVASPTKSPKPLKVRNRDTFKKLWRGCSHNNSYQGASIADDELEGFQGSEDDDVEDMLEPVDSQKIGSVFKYESSHRILGSDHQNITEKKVAKKSPSKDVGISQNRSATDFSKRYFTQHGPGDDHLKCYNCFSIDHIAKECPEPQAVPTCPLCGVKGHTSYVCPHQLCFNCDRPGHQSKLCPFPYQSPYYQCPRCSMYGHLEQMCPDNWRQYHLTTKEGKLVRARLPVLYPDKMFCYNCGLKGHLGYMCEEPRMTVRKGEMIKLPSIPVVCNYRIQTYSRPYPREAIRLLFDEDDMYAQRTVYHYKKKAQIKPNGNMTKVVPGDDVNTERTDDRGTQPLNSSFAANGVKQKKRKSKRRKKKQTWLEASNITPNGPLTMVLRNGKNQNEQSQKEEGTEHDSRGTLQANNLSRNHPLTDKPINEGRKVRKKRKRKGISRQKFWKIKKKMKSLVDSSLQPNDGVNRRNGDNSLL